PEVDQQPCLVGVLEEQAFGQRGHRDAVAASRDIARAEVADGGHAATLGHDGWHSQGECCREATLGIVPDRVPGATDAQYLLQAKADLIGQRPRRRGERFPEQSVQYRDLRRWYRRGRRRLAYQAAQLGAERLATGVDDTCAQIKASAVEFDK